MVAGCFNTHSDRVSLFEFPSEANLRCKWEKQVQGTQAQWKHTEHLVLCSDNFTEDCLMSTQCLLFSVPPTIFIINQWTSISYSFAWYLSCGSLMCTWTLDGRWNIVKNIPGFNRLLLFIQNWEAKHQVHLKTVLSKTVISKNWVLSSLPPSSRLLYLVLPLAS